jgi:hypothetical protein
MQKEREAILKNDKRVASTYLDHTHSEEGGRFAKPQTIVGQTQTPEYPMAAPNWAPQAVGVEPPLGIDVNATEPVGEYGEVTASIERLEEASPQSLDASPARGAAGSLDSICEVEPPLTQSPTIRRKP